MSEFPAEGMELTHILVVDDVDRARRWYEEVLGASPYRGYGGDSAVLSFQGAWLLLVTGGEPTPDKPGVTFAPPGDPERVEHAFTIRVPDCRAAYETLRRRGAEFLTPPYERGREVRCFFRDADGHLFEISEYRRRRRARGSPSAWENPAPWSSASASSPSASPMWAGPGRSTRRSDGERTRSPTTTSRSSRPAG